ncbi:hypothetical protein [Streptomyces sp. CBMA152]|uniref:hypothetical protein n=1 Tax=Streptomyces sp. CBMA152 TaxID=1896312 RepID=UPI001660BFAE|nr:hypothetical protein [Streptomyces sp. CBMA152]
MAWDEQDGIDYAYGGSRTVPFDTSDEETVTVLTRLAVNESQLKNRLINQTIADGVVNDFGGLPPGFLDSNVGGGRCVIRPHDEHVAAILADPLHEDFRATIEPVFAGVGDFLNQMNGAVKLTPDFGRFAGLADLLHRYTPHVLGINRANGGCGGKSSFSTTGVIAAFESLKPNLNGPLTLLGSNGAMGSEFFNYLKTSRYPDVAVADIAYPETQNSLDGYAVLPSAPGCYTDQVLNRAGVIVANTWGNELENSSLQALRPGTLLLLAHNHSVPAGEAGLALMRQVSAQDITALPGQVLTLGGALTSRLEWFSRQAWPGELFNKPLAHDVVRKVVTHLVQRCIEAAGTAASTPYEAMLSI